MGERMLQLSQHRIIVGATLISVVVHLRYQRIQGQAPRECRCVREVLHHEMASRASLISQGGYEPIVDVVLSIQGVVMQVLRWHSAGGISKGEEVCVAGGG